MTLETIIDDLRDGYEQLQPGTMLHADQLMAEQVTDACLPNRVFYVADGPLYSLEGEKKTPTLWLTREPDNLVLRHLNDEVNSSYDQLVNTYNFRPDPQEARNAMQAEDTLRVDLTELRLQGNNAEWQYLGINTINYDTLNAEERKLAERWYGQGEAFAKAMRTLNENGINNTRIYILAPDYVSREAEEGPVGRAAWLNLFFYNADSFAFVHNVSVHNALHGVRQVSREAAAPENLTAPNAPQVNNSPP